MVETLIARIEFEGVDLFDPKRIEPVWWNYRRPSFSFKTHLFTTKIHHKEINLHIGHDNSSWSEWHRIILKDYYMIKDRVFIENPYMMVTPGLTVKYFEYTCARVFVCNTRVNALGRSLPADLARVVASFL